MKQMMISMYTTAHTAPMVSGISLLCTFDMSLPIRPAFMNAGPSHRIMAYVAEKAMPLNASDATSGSPSPRKVLARMPIEARKTESRLSVSEKDRSDGIAAVATVFRTTIAATGSEGGGGGELG